MVWKDYEFLWQQIMSLVSERLHHSIKLLVICGVPSSSIIEFFTQVGYRVPFLTENTAYPYSWSVTCDLEDFGKVREGKDWDLGHSLLEFMKYFWSSFGPGKISFLEAICDEASDGAEASNEPSVEGDKSMETLDFLKIFGFWPFQNGLDLFWVYGNSIGRDNIS